MAKNSIWAKSNSHNSDDNYCILGTKKFNIISANNAYKTFGNK